MAVTVAYGKGRLGIDLPPGIDTMVVEPRYEEGLADQAAAVGDALRHPIASPPLSDLISPGDKIGIVFSDITRATPYEVILPPLLAEVESVPGISVMLFNATGTHRTNTDDELEKILGPGVVGRYRIVQNDCEDAASHRVVGTTPGGNEISLLSEFLECDVKILTGFIEPHFFAGFSGGGKAVMPGLASLETIQRNHSSVHLDDPNVRWAVTTGNPLWTEIHTAAKMAGSMFLLNVSMNRDQQITAVFAGDLDVAHARGCSDVKDHAMVGVDREFDIVVTSNSGYPLDLNLYQSVKGMGAAAQIARPGGAIVVAAQCWDGIPDHGKYGELLRDADSADALLDRVRAPGFSMRDMWQAHAHALLCTRYQVHFYSDNLTDDQIHDGFMTVSRDIDETVRNLVADGARSVCVLPEGPLTVPYVRDK